VSIAAFVLSLCGVTLAAVPLGVWGIVRTKPGRQRGRGLAVAALVISAAWVVASTALVVAMLNTLSSQTLADVPTDIVPSVAPAATAPATDAGSSVSTEAQPTRPLLKPQRVYWLNLKPTMCLRDEGSAVLLVSVVDCRSDHQQEVIARTSLAGPRTWSGDTALTEAALARCRPAFETYVGVGYDSSRLDLYYFVADKAGWAAGNHTLVCVVFDPDNVHLTHTLRGADE
jgi:hypothetical protein